MSDEPFRRQPLSVTVKFEGDPIDVHYWRSELLRRAVFKGDIVIGIERGFIIYPRAVND